VSIDKPLDQAEAMIASDARRTVAPIPYLRRVASLFSGFAQAKAALCSGNVGEAIATAASTVNGLSDSISNDNSEYLLTTVISELRWVQDRFDELDQAHREFMGRDWVSLLTDANRKAREARTKSKVERIAAILCNSAIAVPVPKSDDIEELMRIAVQLHDGDVIVLREVVRTQIHLVRTPERKPTQWEGLESWKKGSWASLGLSVGEVGSVCGKLASFGLVVRLDQPNNQNVMAAVGDAYLLLPKGVEFVTYIRKCQCQCKNPHSAS
jgi:hypothetical protein